MFQDSDIDDYSIKISNASDKNYDLRQQAIQIDIYEDINYPVIRAEIVIQDSSDIISNFPIIGEEIITIDIGEVNYVFSVKNVENQIISDQSMSKVYIIHCASEEMIANASGYVNSKKTGNTDSIIKNILSDNLGSQKTLTIGDPTKGSQSILFSTIRPFQAIDMMRGRAVSQKYKSSSYVFFENQKGFQFTTIEQLMDINKSNIGSKEFFLDTTPKTDYRNKNYRNIISLENLSQFNNVEKLAAGAFKNTVRRFDILTGESTLTTYDDQGKVYKFASNNAFDINTDQYKGKYGKNISKALLIPYSSDKPENYIDIGMGPKIAFLNKINQNIYRIFINGDNTITVGDVIKVHIPNATGDESKADNPLIAENYLVSKLRHTVMIEKAGKSSYHNSLEIIKGFYERSPT